MNPAAATVRAHRLSAGQRSTRQLDAVHRVLRASAAHPCAEQVFRAVRERMPAVSRGTVYRNLAKLVAAGQVRIVQVHDRRARYDARLEPHDHFQCVVCAMLVDVTRSRGRDDAPRTRARIAGHRVSGRVVTWLGTCRACDAPSTTRRG